MAKGGVLGQKVIKTRNCCAIIKHFAKIWSIDGTKYYINMSQYFEFHIFFKLKAKKSVKNDLGEQIITV